MSGFSLFRTGMVAPTIRYSRCVPDSDSCTVTGRERLTKHGEGEPTPQTVVEVREGRSEPGAHVPPAERRLGLAERLAGEGRPLSPVDLAELRVARLEHRSDHQV